jgi:hypothetical protein
MSTIAIQKYHNELELLERVTTFSVERVKNIEEMMNV